MQILETAGLVERVRAGREVLYCARRDPLDASARWLADLATTWDRRLGALKQAAEATSGSAAHSDDVGDPAPGGHRLPLEARDRTGIRRGRVEQPERGV